MLSSLVKAFLVVHTERVSKWADTPLPSVVSHIESLGFRRLNGWDNRRIYFQKAHLLELTLPRQTLLMDSGDHFDVSSSPGPLAAFSSSCLGALGFLIALALLLKATVADGADREDQIVLSILGMLAFPLAGVLFNGLSYIGHRADYHQILAALRALKPAS